MDSNNWQSRHTGYTSLRVSLPFYQPQPRRQPEMIGLPTICHLPAKRKRLRRRWPALPRFVCDGLAALALAAMLAAFAFLTFGIRA